ncbi:MAG: redoxin family protein [Phycisphaerales bacterium]|jgi:thiol-disulfide isomerase/thioredoxin|nr:redoxin family protein [Phycisphaerales bacterium]
MFGKLAAGVVLVASSVAMAGPTLKVGDHAPELKIANWVKGDPVTEFEAGHTYVVEFWATWCPPCRESIPHLTELQAEYREAKKPVTFVGVSSEKDLKVVSSFVDKMGEKMDYVVAFDDTRKTSKLWMDAAEMQGIPCAFIVTPKQEIAYIGYPTMEQQRFEETLAEVADGTFDMASAKAEAARLAEAAAKADAIKKEFTDAMEAGDIPTALAAADRLIEQDPKNFSRLAVVKFNLLAEQDDYAGASTYIREVTKKHYWDDAMVLNAVSWTIVDQFPEDKRDLKLATEFGERAAELTNWKDSMVLDTVAHCYFQSGKVEKAIEIEKKAITLTSDPDMKAEFERLVKEWESQKSGG